MPGPLPIAFVDTETTHLDASIGEAWEVAVILREQDGEETTDTEYVWQIRPDLTASDSVTLEALRIGRFEERFVVPPHAEAAFTAHESGHITPMTRQEAVTAIVNVLSGAVIVGSNPGFDDRFLRKLVGPGGAQWHYRPYDIVLLAAAKIGAQQAGPLPWSSHVLSRAVGVEPPTAETAHTALGDARWARDVHDAAMVRRPVELSWEGRASHAIGLYTRTAIELEDAQRALARHEKVAKALHIHLHALRARPGRDITTDFVRSVLERLIAHPQELCDLEQDAAAVQRAHALASQWAVLRAHGGAATQLRAVLGGREPNALPAGFSIDTCVTAKCAVCEYEFDEEESSTIHFEDIDTAHATLRGYDWTILPDGRAICPAEDDEHQVLRPAADAPSQDVSPDQTVLDIGDPDEDEELEEAGDVLDLISEIASRLRDATDEGEYHAVGLIGDLANGRTTVAEARTALAEIRFRHV